jgi:hypothetical protein
MDRAQRQSLREAHRPFFMTLEDQDLEAIVCEVCETPYPCDMVQLLNETEPTLCQRCDREITKNGAGWKHLIDDGKLCSAPSPEGEEPLLPTMRLNPKYKFPEQTFVRCTYGPPPWAMETKTQ